MAITLQALPDAVEQLGGKNPVASVLRSKDWEAMPLALKQRAFWSAGVNWADFLSTSKSKLMDSIALKREQLANGKSAFVDRGSFIGDMRAMVLGAGEGDGTGTVTDLASRARLGLIYDMQIGQAQGFSKFKYEQRPAVLNMFPAQELIRLENRKSPRDWAERWVKAGGRLINGRMIALKTDPIWERISRFGVPWPPFDYASGMGLRDVRRSEAIALGLLAEDDVLEPVEADFNAAVVASGRNLDPDVREQLQAALGDQVEITDEGIRLVGLQEQAGPRTAPPLTRTTPEPAPRQEPAPRPEPAKPTIAPDEDASPKSIIPVNETDSARVSRLAASMETDGWQGPPILVLDDGNGLRAATGSHRIAAAQKAGIDVPIRRIDFDKFSAWSEETGNTFDDFLGFDDGDKAAALRRMGDLDAAALMQYEHEQNQ